MSDEGIFGQPKWDSGVESSGFSISIKVDALFQIRPQGVRKYNTYKTRYPMKWIIGLILPSRGGGCVQDKPTISAYDTLLNA